MVPTDALATGSRCHLVVGVCCLGRRKLRTSRDIGVHLARDPSLPAGQDGGSMTGPIWACQPARAYLQHPWSGRLVHWSCVAGRACTAWRSLASPNLPRLAADPYPSRGENSRPRASLEGRRRLPAKGGQLREQHREWFAPGTSSALAQERHLRHAVDCIELLYKLADSRTSGGTARMVRKPRRPGSWVACFSLSDWRREWFADKHRTSSDIPRAMGNCHCWELAHCGHRCGTGCGADTLEISSAECLEAMQGAGVLQVVSGSASLICS